LMGATQSEIDPHLEFGKESILFLKFPNRPV